MGRTMRLCTAMGCAALLAGACAQTESFTPTEKATAVSPRGYSAADYDLSTKTADLGEVKVWSNGARRMKFRGRKHTFIHVAFDIENETDQPLTLVTDQLYLDSTTLDDTILEDVEPTIIDGPESIPPREAMQVDVYFAMPRGVDPDDIDAFRVRWVLSDDKQTYAQFTPFIEFEPYYYAGAPGYYYSPFYDPFFYDPFLLPPRFAIYNYPYYYPYVY